MRLTRDEAKRKKTFVERKLDFAEAAEVFEGITHTFQDARRIYLERRFVTVGFLGGRLIVLVSTPRRNGAHIISMRKANVREQRLYKNEVG
jgi:uncharacterized protein